MKRLSYLLLVLLLLIIWLLVARGSVTPAVQSLLGLVFPETLTLETLQHKYDQKKLRILLVPGHDHDYTGTAFHGLKEEQLNVEMASALAEVLKSDPHYELTSTRDLNTGDYNPELWQYLQTHREEIISHTSELKSTFNALVVRGEIPLQQGMNHLVAPDEVAIRLYGINAWANERGEDLALHIHFNDYGGRPAGQSGRYSGLAVYVPEGHYGNARVSKELGLAISTALQERLALSDFPQEEEAVTEDQSLIAIGAYGSREGGAILLEYGYIYEPQWQSAALREIILPELANRTAAGLKKYFEPEATFSTSVINLPLNARLGRQSEPSPAVLQLQLALARAGFYPPLGKGLSACPLSAVFGRCTASAVTAFQKKYSIPSTGVLDEITGAKLNSLASQ